MRIGSSHDHPDNRGVWVETWVIDLVDGDLSAALLLSQLLWWHQPGKAGRPKLRFEREGHLWLTRTDDDWWMDCRLTMRQVRRIRAQLESTGLIEHKVVRVGTTTVSAWRPNIAVIQEAQDRNADVDEDGVGVTRWRHSRGRLGLTPSGQSGSDAKASVPRSDAKASVPSDARASVHSLLDPEVSEEQEPIAASRPPAHRRADAESIVRSWWEESDPTPVNSFVGVVGVIEKFLAAGYPDSSVAKALRQALCPTTNSLLVALNGAKRPLDTPDAVEAMTWLEEHTSGE